MKTAKSGVHTKKSGQKYYLNMGSSIFVTGYFGMGNCIFVGGII